MSESGEFLPPTQEQMIGYLESEVLQLKVKHEDRERQLVGALSEAYMLVHHAWNTARFGSGSADEAKELRREMASVLGRVGLKGLYEVYAGHPLPWTVAEAECLALTDQKNRLLAGIEEAIEFLLEEHDSSPESLKAFRVLERLLPPKVSSPG
jgi:hypothetical protein